MTSHTHIHTTILTEESPSLPLPQSMTSAPVARICAMRTPSAPTPSEDTCAPASRATWATAPSAEVISRSGTSPQTHKHPQTPDPNLPPHPLMVAGSSGSVTSWSVWFTPPSHQLTRQQLPRR